MVRPVRPVHWAIALGAAQLMNAPATLDTIEATLKPLARDEVIRTCVRMINAMALDRQLRESQDPLVAWLPIEARLRYRQFRRDDADVRLFHPFQQLMLIHAAARFSTGDGTHCSSEEKMQRWALASIQINDHIGKAAPPDGLSRPDKAMFLISEEVARWELMNPSNPNRSLGRLRAMLVDEVPYAGQSEAEAAERLRNRFGERLRLSFTTAFNLAAFLVYWWRVQTAHAPTNLDAATIELPKWLKDSSISVEDQRSFLFKVSMETDEVGPLFEPLGGMSLHQLIPFRRRPLLRIDRDHFAFICPQFVVEKGGVDLLWLSAHEPGGPKEDRPWQDDFGLLYERYIRLILERLGDRLGGRFLPDIHWADNEDQGQIDGLIHSYHSLFIVETKASLLRQHILNTGTVDEVRKDIEAKFVGNALDQKGVAQLLRAVAWLARERQRNNTVCGIDLRKISEVIPILVVADRAMRFPPVALWLNHRMQVLRSERQIKSPGALRSLIVCGTEDIENLEQLALQGERRPTEVIGEFARDVTRVGEALWQQYNAPHDPHPRLNAIFDRWLGELSREGVLPS